MSDTVSALKLFVRVARLSSFSRAGLEFEFPQPSVSRAIRDLEREVGASQLGHGNPNTTLRWYAHWLPTALR